MPKREANPMEKKVYVGIKNNLLITLHQLGYNDVNTAIDNLIAELQKREEAYIFLNDIISKLANRIELIERAYSKIKVGEEVEINKQILERQLEEVKEILQQHLDHLNRNSKVKV